MTSPDTFNNTIHAWKAEQDTPWFRLRYSVVQHNLLRHLDQTPLRILDVGGGNGRETLALAAHGHHVTLVDYSPEMLADARLKVEEAGLTERIDLHEADLIALPTLFAPESFDVVLCHNVLQYVGDPGEAVKDVAALVRPAGYVSVLSPNRYGETYLRALLHNDLATALGQLDATTVEATLFKVPVHRFSGNEMIELLRQAGCSTASHYGVLCVCAYIPNNDLKYDPAFFAQLEQLELALSDRHPYNQVARFFHVIALKEVGT
jgi:S-adenosylmethionine-dependent methyltransferase